MGRELQRLKKRAKGEHECSKVESHTPCQHVTGAGCRLQEYHIHARQDPSPQIAEQPGIYTSHAPRLLQGHRSQGPVSERFSPPPRRRLYSTLIRTEPAKLAGNQEYNVKQTGKLSEQAHTCARATQAALAYSTPFSQTQDSAKREIRTNKQLPNHCCSRSVLVHQLLFTLLL